MTLLSRLCWDEGPRIDLHAFKAMLALFTRGALTRADIFTILKDVPERDRGRYGPMNAGERADLQHWLENLTPQEVERIFYAIDLAQKKLIDKSRVKQIVGSALRG